MRTDRELLELAAEAAGLLHIEYTNDYDGSLGIVLCDEIGRHQNEWNPLNDDGDALRLAVKLGLDIECHGCLTTFPYAVAFDCERNIAEEEQPEDGDGLKATRRAIVRVAAEIGALSKSKQGESN